jgi:hypothetical protein
MNRLKTTDTGRMPFVLDDLRFSEEAIREAIYGLISAFGIEPRDSFRLSGCEISINGSVYSTTAGYICLNGEVLKVDAHNVTLVNGQGIKWAVGVSYDPSGNKIFADHNAHDCYEIRRGILISQSVGMNDMDATAPYLIDLIKTNSNLCEAWHNVGENGEPAFEQTWANKSGEDVVAFRKDNQNVVHIKGIATISSGHGAIFTLPLGYRPSATRRFVTSYDGSDFTSLQIDHTTGYVFVNTLNSTDVNLNITFAL